MPKTLATHKTFASIMQNGLLPHVATLKSITGNLHHATARHRLKHMPKMQPRHIDTQIITQQIAIFCAKQLVPAFDDANSIKIIAQSFITKKQERQREQQEHIPVTQEHEANAQNGTQPLAPPPASLGTSPIKTQPPAYSAAQLRKRMKDAFKKAMQLQNRPNSTLEEKKNQVLGAALEVWKHNPRLDFEQISLGLKYYFDFSRADIIELENRLWFNRPEEVRQRLAEKNVCQPESTKNAEASLEESEYECNPPVE